MKKIFLKDFIPKKDTQQEEFLQKYPSYDGRGIKIAIIDTGVDVSLDGLQKTSTGFPKIIDCFDFTGAADIPPNWKNPSNEWHLGIKSNDEILPKIEDEYENQKKNGNEKNIQMHENNEITKVKEINTLTKNPFIKKDIDCIVWNDGEKWQACIFCQETKNPEDVKILTNFRDCHEYCIILGNVACCVTIHEDENLLELIAPKNDHGSAVSQVAAAHFPDRPWKDGLAPGAQIISMKVCGKNVTVNILEKALSKCIDMDVDIVNFSIYHSIFNESTIKTLLKKMINEHGKIILKCTGNDGPFILSTKLYSNDLYDEIFYIGSIFKPNFNSIFEKSMDTFQPFILYASSRGPFSTGPRGVTFVAPTSIVVENPKWQPLEKEIFNGTSCAAPYTAGSIACLLTALKANSIPYTPAIVKLALSNTALLPDDGEEDPLAYGNGIIQISSAFEYFLSFKNNNLHNIVFPKILVEKFNHHSGITVYNCSIECDKQISWILKLSSPENQHIQHSVAKNNSFIVKIDTKSLKPGKVYYSEINGFDPSNFSLGPIFHLPITLIFPENVINYRIQKQIIIQSPSIFKLILNPPNNSMKCIVKLINPENEKNIIVEIVCEKLLSEKNEIYKRFNPNETAATTTICEWEIAVKWSSKIFEIYIYQKIFIERFYNLKSFLQVHFYT